MPDLAGIEAELARLDALFAEAGYQPTAAAHLFPATMLLDLYGEDVRGRAFLFPGGGGGDELCLRPDFTVPVVIAHGRTGWQRPARYAYRGPVFRRQTPGSTRPIEYLQAGIENLGAADAATADAQVLGLLLRGLEELGAGPVTLATGDLGIVFALLAALPMSPQRRAQLRRHVWRPGRFHALIGSFAAPAPAPSPARAALIAATRAPDPLAAVTGLAAQAGDILGLREPQDILARARALAAATDDPAMPTEHARLIEQALTVRGPSGAALGRLRALMAEAGADLTATLDRFEARLDALNRAGIDAEEIPFDAAFGRSLEYYDGFVFEVQATGRPDLPPLAGGGRYDAMTGRLGATAPIPAVGGMIRPEAVFAARSPT